MNKENIGQPIQAPYNQVKGSGLANLRKKMPRMGTIAIGVAFITLGVQVALLTGVVVVSFRSIKAMLKNRREYKERQRMMNNRNYQSQQNYADSQNSPYMTDTEYGQVELEKIRQRVEREKAEQERARQEQQEKQEQKNKEEDISSSESDKSQSTQKDAPKNEWVEEQMELPLGDVNNLTNDNDNSSSSIQDQDSITKRVKEELEEFKGGSSHTIRDKLAQERLAKSRIADSRDMAKMNSDTRRTVKHTR